MSKSKSQKEELVQGTQGNLLAVKAVMEGEPPLLAIRQPDDSIVLAVDEPRGDVWEVPDRASLLRDDPALTQVLAMGSNMVAHRRSKGADWVFYDNGPVIGREGLVVASKHLFSDSSEPVTYVSHSARGNWAFLGDTDVHDDPSELVLVEFVHLLAADATLAQIVDLPPGQCATRESIKDGWERAALTD